MSSSSSESSEDEEEIKKISEAVIPNDLLSSLTSPLSSSKTKYKKDQTETEHASSVGSDGSNTCFVDSEQTLLRRLATKFKKKERKVDTALLKLKSNRPDKMTEEDQSSYHATTPGFRAHIEKRLLQILDSDVQGSMRDVWKKTSLKKEKNPKGIKLFSDVKSLCLGETDVKQSQEMNVARSPPKIIPRKRKFNSSSSESSDDEVKINSCVFTVDDIMHENRMLENLAKSGLVSNSSVKDSKDGNESNTLNLDNEKSITEKGKKKLSDNVKDVSDDNLCTTKGEDEGGTEKKKKKLKENSNGRQESNSIVNHSLAQNDEPVKKKKKKKKKCQKDVS